MRGLRRRRWWIALAGIAGVREPDAPPRARPVLRVRVVDAGGAPVPRATVTLWPRVRTEAVAGRAEIASAEVCDGFTSLEVSDPRDDGGRPLPLAGARVDLELRQSGEVVVVLPPERAISGRVVGPDGRGAAGVLVFAERDGAPRAVRTDEGGAFRIGGVAAGTYRVGLEVPPGLLGPPAADLPGGTQDVLLRLRAAVRPKITVLDPEGKPVVGAWVFLYGPASVRGEDVGEPTSDDEGAVHPLLDPDAVYDVTVTRPADRRDLRSTQIRGWRPADLVVRLPPAWTVSGTVRDREGAPVAEVLVLGQGADETVDMGRTDASGRFDLRDLAEGPVSLQASASPDPSLATEVTVAAGSRDVALVVDRGVEATVRVENLPEGVTQLAAALWPEDESAFGFAHDATYEDGVLRFTGLAPGRTYSLCILPSPDAPDWSLWQAGVRPAKDEVRVRLVQGRTIRGRVVIPEGCHDVSVLALRGAASLEAAVAADGTFELKGVPEGRWTLRATATGPTGPVEGVAEASAGDTVEIVLKP